MGTRLMSSVACLLIILHQVINEVAGDGVFSREPVDKILTVSYNGSTKSFLLDCTVIVQSIIKVSWIKNDVVISENDTLLVNRDTAHVVYGGRYAINSQDNRKFYQLIINDITPDTAAFDSGRYQCKVTWTNSGSISVDKSSVATVIIYAMPDDEYLQCTMTDSDNTQVVQILPRTIVREDETYTLKCVSEPGNPAVTLSWSKSSQAEMFDVSSKGRTNDGLFFSESEWNPTIDDSVSATLLVCTMYHPQLQQDRTCTLGPFNVTYKPKVTLNPETSYIFSNGNSGDRIATFKYSIDAIPQIYSITWYFDDTILNPGGHFTFNGNSLIIDGSDWEGKSNHSIECRATNALGDGSAFGALLVNTPLPTTASPGAKPKLITATEMTTNTSESQGVARKSAKNSYIAVGLGATGGVLFVCVLAVVMVCLLKRRRITTRTSLEKKSEIIENPHATSNTGDGVSRSETSEYSTLNVTSQAGTTVDQQVDIDTMYAKLVRNVFKSSTEINVHRTCQDDNKSDTDSNEKINDLVHVMKDKISVREQIKKKNDESKKREKPTLMKTLNATTTELENANDFVYDESIVHYAATNKSGCIDDCKSAKDADERSHDIRAVNAEGLTYAELDHTNFAQRKNTRQSAKMTEATVYAELKM